jgi:hypothetical protein
MNQIQLRTQSFPEQLARRSVFIDSSEKSIGTRIRRSFFDFMEVGGDNLSSPATARRA